MVLEHDGEDAEATLESFFRPGITAEDLPALFPLLHARAMLRTFRTLFHGADGGILVRLLVLREIGSRAESPSWSPQELRAHFSFLEETKFQTVLNRLKGNELLLMDPETGRYRVSPEGRTALTAISALLKWGDDEGDELGFITSQLAASDAVDKVSAEDLQHLLARLTELQDSFDEAVLSGSEFRIKAAERSLGSVLMWVEKATALVRTIAHKPSLDRPAHQLAQRIGMAQSRMLRMTAVFQRTLNQLDAQRVHLGSSGLSSGDVVAWLRDRTVEELINLPGGAVHFTPHTSFLLGDIVLDIAEYELVERVRQVEWETALPQPMDAPATQNVITEEEDLTELVEWKEELGRVNVPTPLADLVTVASYEHTAYRLSLLALLGDAEAQALQGPVAELGRLPLRLELSGKLVSVARGEIGEMSEGMLVPQRGERDGQ